PALAGPRVGDRDGAAGAGDARGMDDAEPSHAPAAAAARRVEGPERADDMVEPAPGGRPARPALSARGGAALLAAAFLLGAAGLAVNVAAALDRIPDPLLENLPPRFWQDLHMAESLYLFGEFPVTANEVERWRDPGGV